MKLNYSVVVKLISFKLKFYPSLPNKHQPSRYSPLVQHRYLGLVPKFGPWVTKLGMGALGLVPG